MYIPCTYTLQVPKEMSAYYISPNKYQKWRFEKDAIGWQQEEPVFLNSKTEM